MLTFALGVLPVFWPYLAVMALLGAFMPLFNTPPATVLIQKTAEPDYMGRLFNVLSMLSSLMSPLGMLVFGPLSDMIKIEWMLIGTGLLIFAVGFLVLFSKALRAKGETD